MPSLKFIAVFCGLTLVMVRPAQPSDESTAIELVNHVLGRHDQLKSFDIEVLGRFGVSPVAREQTQTAFRIVSDGKQWVFRWLAQNQSHLPLPYDVCRSDGQFIFGNNPDGADHKHGLAISLPTRLERPKRVFTLAHNLGGIWHEQTRDYLRKNRQRARLGGEQSVLDTPCVVVDLEVPASEVFDAFVAVQNRELLRDGGVLRMWVAPSLGFAVPRYQNCSHNGIVDVDTHGSHFKNVAKDFFYPTFARRQTIGVPVNDKVDPESIEGYRVEFEVTKVWSVNQAIADREFDLIVPEDTVVSDGRPNRRIRFVVGKDTIVSHDRFDEWAIGFVPQLQTSTSIGWSRRGLLLLGFCACTATAIIVWLLKRYMHHHG